MKRLLMITGILCSFTIGSATAQTLSTVTLKDKTVVRGEVVGMANGSYTIKSPSLGKLEIPVKQVLSIVSDEAGETEPAVSTASKRLSGMPAVREGHPKAGKKNLPSSTTAQSSPADSSSGDMESDGETSSGLPDSKKLGQMQSDVNGRVQSMMMSNDFSQKAMNMSESSEMEDVLNDPETMNAIRNNDYESLMNNEKMKKLMDSSGVKDMVGNFEDKE